MPEQLQEESLETRVEDTVAAEIVRLLGLVRRLENENASLRRELTSRSLPA